MHHCPHDGDMRNESRRRQPDAEKDTICGRVAMLSVNTID
jgi:hypothetical protein